MSVSVCFVCLFVCLCVCLCVCISVCLSSGLSSKLHTSDLHQIFGASYRGPTHSGRGYMTLFWRRCGYTLCTSGFMDDVIFAQLRPVGLPYLDGSVAEWLACWTLAQIEGPGFKSKPRRCRVTVLGKLFTPIVPLFTKQQNW